MTSTEWCHHLESRSVPSASSVSAALGCRARASEARGPSAVCSADHAAEMGPASVRKSINATILHESTHGIHTTLVPKLRPFLFWMICISV